MGPISKVMEKWLRDKVQEYNVFINGLGGEGPSNLEPTPMADLAILAAAFGNAYQGSDDEGQYGSTYSWEDASCGDFSDDFRAAFDELINVAVMDERGGHYKVKS